ncbi:MAG: flagellar hook-basal body complex protein [Planctomycetota bacterium]|nr:flagellar hook-basal body complex protein [Planctomycetota bacterium]
MGLTTALYSGLSGLAANSQLITVAGNNLANVNTTAFKSSRADFESQFSETLSPGSAPSSALGGTNPEQIGLGTRLGGITRNLKEGSIQPTGNPGDIALEGKGYFVVNVDGSQRFTRAGDFKLDRDQDLVTSTGARLQGYAVDENYNILPGQLADLNVPLGNLTLAEATKNVRFNGNLNVSGDPNSTRANVTGQTLYSDSAHTTPATGATALTSLFDSTGTPVFSTGSVITIAGATKGGATLPTHTFEVGATNTTGSDTTGTTYQDLADFFNGTLGVDTSITGDPAGVAVTAGQLAITGNGGSVNDIALDSSQVSVVTGSTTAQPLAFTKNAASDGESVRTAFVAYDSVGAPVTIDLSMAMESKTSSGTTWRYYAQSDDGSSVGRVVGTGTLSFDTSGHLLDPTTDTVTLQRAATGAAPSQDVTLNFGGQGGLSAFSNSASQITATTLDGSPIGTLESFAVGSDGMVTGIFSNTRTRTLGQVALATFANPEGLTDQGGNLFSASASSGDAGIVTPGMGGTGGLVGGALELSNVDLSQEFVNLISASTGFSANSRVLTTSDRLIQELLQTIR